MVVTSLGQSSHHFIVHQARRERKKNCEDKKEKKETKESLKSNLDKQKEEVKQKQKE